MASNGPSAAQQSAEADMAKREAQLQQEEEEQKKEAQQRQLSMIRRSFGSQGGSLPSGSTSLLG